MNIIDKLKEKNGLEFNQEQLEILNHLLGSAIVHSTAGSGKTTMICSRIGLLINDYNVSPEKILVLSYSNASVNDIFKRYKELMTGKIHSRVNEKLRFSTVHSFGMSIINYYSRKTGIEYKIAGTRGIKGKNAIIRDIFKDLYNRNPQTTEIDRIINGITLLNNSKMNDGFIRSTESNIDNLAYFYNKYNEYKQENKIIDFDDMLIKSTQLLRENQALRKYYKARYEYILVDEVQDMSKIQYELLRLIVNDYENIMAFGDSDQSIYGFRGSYRNIFIDFTKDFPSIKKYQLDINYRCDVNIVDISSKFIELAKNRPSREISAYSQDLGTITVASFKNDEEQSEFLVKEIKEKYSGNLGETAILFRDSLSLIKPVTKLINKELEFYCNKEEYNIFRHFTKNDIIGAIWLSYNRSLVLALWQFYNKINLNLTRGDMLRLWDKHDKKEDLFHCFKRIGGLSKEQKLLVEELEKDLDHLAKLKPYEAIDYFLKDMNYKDYLSSLSKGITYESSIYSRYIDIMRYLTKNEPSVRTYIDWVARLQVRVRDSFNNSGKDAVTLSTLHSAKGLEFDNVFIIDTNENILPSYLSKDDKVSSKMEEERRLMYVGLTRARKNLYILSSGRKSQYIREIESILEKTIKGN